MYEHLKKMEICVFDFPFVLYQSIMEKYSHIRICVDDYIYKISKKQPTHCSQRNETNITFQYDMRQEFSYYGAGKVVKG